MMFQQPKNGSENGAHVYTYIYIYLYIYIQMYIYTVYHANGNVERKMMEHKDQSTLAMPKNIKAN